MLKAKFRSWILRNTPISSHTSTCRSYMKLLSTLPLSISRFCKYSQNFEYALPFYQDTLDSIRNAGTWKNERFIASPQSAVICTKHQDSTQKVINFCANNYLGLCNHPKVVESAKKAIDEYGAGLSSVRFICGTQVIHKELENKLAAFHKRDDAILFSSCFEANTGIFQVLLGAEDAVISDELNHASIIDGLRLCKAKKLVYKNVNMHDLEEKLSSVANARIKMIVTDGVFSMDGIIAPLPDIIRLARKYNALTFIDECHATGFLGKTGRGTEEFWNVMGQIDIINSTLGKCLGGASGGYTVAPQPLIDLLRQRARSYLFSNALAPSLAGSAIAALDLIENDPSLLQNIVNNTETFRSSMTELGFTVIGHEQHPICPVMLGDAKLASVFADKMLQQGIYVIGFSFPVVPHDKARIRVQISAAHSLDQVKKCVDAFRVVGKELNVIC